MASFEDQEFNIRCPSEKCKSPIKLRNRDAYTSRVARCTRCHTEIVLDSSATGDLKSAVSDVDRALEKLQHAQVNILKNAEVKMKL